jgi:hypothetical protein
MLCSKNLVTEQILTKTLKKTHHREMKNQHKKSLIKQYTKGVPGTP